MYSIAMGERKNITLIDSTSNDGYFNVNSINVYNVGGPTKMTVLIKSVATFIVWYNVLNKCVLTSNDGYFNVNSINVYK